MSCLAENYPVASLPCSTVSIGRLIWFVSVENSSRGAVIHLGACSTVAKPTLRRASTKPGHCLFHDTRACYAICHRRLGCTILSESLSLSLSPSPTLTRCTADPQNNHRYTKSTSTCRPPKPKTMHLPSNCHPAWKDTFGYKLRGSVSSPRFGIHSLANAYR